MRLLLDSHILLWAAYEPHKLSRQQLQALDDPANELFFSVASTWELGMKCMTSRGAFQANVPLLRERMLLRGYKELNITHQHALENMHLPFLHKDPFDRILIAQAQVEGLLLVTDDPRVRNYPGLQTALLD